MNKYDPHEMKVIRRGVSPSKVIALYKHFGSLRPVAKICGIAPATVSAVLKRYGISQTSKVSMPKKVSYSSRKLYGDFAMWLKLHSEDDNLPSSVSALAKLSGTSIDSVKCYFYRRRKQSAKILRSLPDLRKLQLSVEDIGGRSYLTKDLINYHYVIDRYSEKAAIQGTILYLGTVCEITAIIPSIEQFAERVRSYVEK